jgi:hypothetical protein
VSQDFQLDTNGDVPKAVYITRYLHVYGQMVMSWDLSRWNCPRLCTAKHNISCSCSINRNTWILDHEPAAMSTVQQNMQDKLWDDKAFKSSPKTCAQPIQRNPNFDKFRTPSSSGDRGYI